VPTDTVPAAPSVDNKAKNFDARVGHDHLAQAYVDPTDDGGVLVHGDENLFTSFDGAKKTAGDVVGCCGIPELLGQLCQRAGIV
jgi:hypothetical protein